MVLAKIHFVWIKNPKMQLSCAVLYKQGESHATIRLQRRWPCIPAIACCCPPPFDRCHCQGCRRNTIKVGFKSVSVRMEKNEEWRMVGNNGMEKQEGDVQKENETKTEGGIERERGKKGGEKRSKSREGRVGLLNTKAYLDRRLLHLGPRKKVCWQQLSITLSLNSQSGSIIQASD